MTEPHGRPPAAHPTVRPVFRRALRDLLVLVAALAVVGGVVGWLVAGSPGLWGALVGAVVTLVASGTTVVSMLATADRSVGVTGGVVLGAWAAKMLVVVLVLTGLRGREAIDVRVLAVVVVVGVLGSALLDYRAVARGRVPYTERA